MRTNLERHKYVNVRYISQDIVQMNFYYKDEFVEKSFTTNPCLRKLDRRAVYCDTDSIKYTVSDTDKPLIKMSGSSSTFTKFETPVEFCQEVAEILGLEMRSTWS